MINCNLSLPCLHVSSIFNYYCICHHGNKMGVTVKTFPRPPNVIERLHVVTDLQMDNKEMTVLPPLFPSKVRNHLLMHALKTTYIWNI